MEKLEIIIVNDGSKDETSQIAHELALKYPESIVVVDKENGGYGSTINTSLSVAKGKYFKLLDGDDWFDNTVLSQYIDFLETIDTDLVIAPYYEVRKEYSVNDAHKEIPATGCEIESIEIENKYFAMHEIAVKTEVLRTFGKKITEHCFYTDAEYTFYCFCASETIARFDKPVYCYRLELEGQSVSVTGIRKHYEDFPIVAESLYACYIEQNQKRQLGKQKKSILDLCINNITYHTYNAFLLLENAKDSKQELLSFDRSLRTQYGSLYKITNNSKRVRALRFLRFRPYSLLSKIAISLFMKENS